MAGLGQRNLTEIVNLIIVVRIFLSFVNSSLTTEWRQRRNQDSFISTPLLI